MIEIPRVTGQGDGVGLAWYWSRPHPEQSPDLIVRCPHGHTGRLLPIKHQVAADGTVSPSIWFKELCDALPEFHDHGRLLGWVPADAGLYGAL